MCRRVLVVVIGGNENEQDRGSQYLPRYMNKSDHPAEEAECLATALAGSALLLVLLSNKGKSEWVWPININSYHDQHHHPGTPVSGASYRLEGLACGEPPKSSMPSRQMDDVTCMTPGLNQLGLVLICGHWTDQHPEHGRVSGLNPLDCRKMRPFWPLQRPQLCRTHGTAETEPRGLATVGLVEVKDGQEHGLHL